MPVGRKVSRKFPATGRKKLVTKLVEPKSKAYSMAKAIQTVDRRVSILKSQVKKEQNVGYLETFNSAVSVSNAGITPILLNGAVRGTDQTTRLGDEFVMKMLHMKFTLLSSDTTNIYRVSVVYDKEPRGASPTLTDIFVQTTVTEPVFAYRNPDYLERFQVLYDKRFYSTTGTSNQLQYNSVNIPLNRKVNAGLGNTGTIADLSYGALWLIAWSDSAGVPHPTLRASTRVSIVQ